MKQPVLVTGSHRSGKSLITKGIAQSGKYNIIHEPLNVNQRIGRNGLNIDNYYTYINDSNNDRYKTEFDKTLSYDYRLLKELKMVNSLYDVGIACKDILLSIKNKMNKKTPLIDDPFAVFSAEWFYQVYDAKVIILIRRPASFVSSLKTLNYHFPFADLLGQDELINKKLEPFKNEIKEFIESKKSIVEQGELLWRIIYSSVLDYKYKYQDKWLFLKFEDLLDKPYNTFMEAYFYLVEEYNDHIFNKIEKKILLNKSDKERIVSIENDTCHYPYQIQKYKYEKNLTINEIEYINKYNDYIYDKL